MVDGTMSEVPKLLEDVALLDVVEPELVLDDELPLLLVVAEPLSQVKVPLITLFEPERAEKVEQSLEMSPDDTRLKAPRTSSRPGRTTLCRNQYVGTVNNCYMYLRSHVAVEVKSTTNSGEVGEAVNVLQAGVVGDLETTADGRELRHGEVGHVLVADERERATDSGKVRRRQAADRVGVETHRTVERSERRDGDGGAVPEGHVERPDQVGEGSVDGAAVGLEGQGGRDVGKLHVDLLKVWVVGNGDAVHDLEVNAVKRVELGVLDRHLRCGLHTSGEGQTLESRKSNPVNVVNVCEAWEVQGGEDGQVVEREHAGDGLEAAAGDLSDLCDVVGDQVSLDLSDAIESNVVGGASGDSNASSEG